MSAKYADLLGVRRGNHRVSERIMLPWHPGSESYFWCRDCGAYAGSERTFDRFDCPPPEVAEDE